MEIYLPSYLSSFSIAFNGLALKVRYNSFLADSIHWSFKYDIFWDSYDVRDSSLSSHGLYDITKQQYFQKIFPIFLYSHLFLQ